MQVSYKRDLNHNYMILKTDEKVDTDSYQIRLLTGNHLPGFLQGMTQVVNGQVIFYYEITAKQSLANIYEQQKMKREDLQRLFDCLVKRLEEMRSYLLEAGNLLLSPEYIYLDASRKEVFFCYFPVQQKEITASLQELAEYLLPKIDHTDQPAVLLGYNIYRYIMEDGICLEQIKRELYRENPVELKNEEQKREELWVEEDMVVDDSAEELLQALLEEKEGAVHPAISTIIIAISGIFLFVYFYFLNNTEFSWHIYVLAAVALLVLAGISAGIYLFKMRKQKNKKEVNAPEEGGNSYDDIEVRVEKEWLANQLKDEQHEEQTLARGEETVIIKSPGLEKMPCLVGVHPPMLQPVLIKKEVFILGKLEKAVDAVLPSFAVSRIHAKIIKDGEYYISDLNSLNGTYVNHEILSGEEKHRLNDGDEITLGDLTYCFKEGGMAN